MNYKNLETDNIKYSNKKIFTVGIVGAGDVVAKSHLPQLLALENVSVSWVTDIDSQLAKRVARNYNVKWLSMPLCLEDLPYTDVVLLATPYGAREPYFEVLRERNSAIYLEKPVARSVAEHKQLNALFPPSNFAVGFQRRSLGTVSLLKKMVLEEMFGRLIKVQFRHGGSANVFSGKAFSTNSKLAGGGVLIEHGIHGLDLALFISGAKSANSYQVKTVIEKGFDVHAEGQIILNNSSGDYEFDFKVSWLSEVEEGLTFFFENAIAFMSLEIPEILLKSLNGKTLVSISNTKTLYPTTGMQVGGEFWRSFLMGINSGKKNYTSMESCLLTTEIIEKIFVKGAKQ